MTLLGPLYLAAAAGVVVPILIHLFGRPRPRHVRFPSLRLLRVAHRERHSSVRLQRLLSLILRCLALLLLAAALALPAARARWLAALGRPLGTTAILVDASASMRAGVGGRAAIARAREAATGIIESLPPGEPLLLAGAGAALHPAADEPLPARQAGEAVAGLRTTDERGRLGECLAAAVGDRAGRPATAFVITDMQATSFGWVPEQGLSRGTSVVVVDVGPPPADNLAITGTSLRDRPALRGRPLTIEAELRAFGDTGGRVPVTLTHGEQVEGAAAATVLPGGGASAQLELTPREAGPLAAEARVPADDFALDDRRLVAAVVRARLRVVVAGSEAATRFVRAALDPFPAGDERSTIEVVPVDPAVLSAADLERVDAVVLAELAAISPEALTAVRDAARLGAGVLVYAGPASPGERALSSLDLGGVEIGEAQSQEDGLALAEFATRRPPLDAFAEPGAGDLSAARFPITRALRVDEAAATVLARFDDGSPALVEAAVGRGTVLLLATAPDDAWSDLPRLPVYVPLMHTLVGHLAGGSSPAVLQASPGEVAAGWVRADTSDLRAVGPEAEAVGIERLGDAWRFTPDRIGAWRVLAGEEDICALAVNLDPAESNPARVSTADLRAALQPADVTVVAADDVARVLGALTRPVDISALFALLALLALAADGALVHRGADGAQPHG